MSTLVRKGHCVEERRVTARMDHRCEWCGGAIPAGASHIVCKEFPGGEAGYADAAGHPVRMRIHDAAPCWYPPIEDAR